MVSFLFMAWSHLLFISSSWWCFPCITLLHLSTHMRYANSRRSIWRSLVGPWCVLFRFHCCSLFGLSSVCRCMQLHPRIVPRLISSHGILLCGYSSQASLHIMFIVHSSHCIRMWSIDLVVLQCMHVGFSSNILLLCECCALLYIGIVGWLVMLWIFVGFAILWSQSRSHLWCIVWLLRWVVDFLLLSFSVWSPLIVVFLGILLPVLGWWVWLCWGQILSGHLGLVHLGPVCLHLVWLGSHSLRFLLCHCVL